MKTAVQPARPAQTARPAAWLAAPLLPAAAIAFASDAQPWILMWLLALAVFFALKWLTLSEALIDTQTSRSRALLYLFTWPGLDARRFFTSQRAMPPDGREWFAAAVKTLLGFTLWCSAGLVAANGFVHTAGWMAMTSLALVLHFGMFHVLSLAWREAGVDAPPLMDAPPKATSLGEFWGRRWNRAFRDVSMRFIFEPLRRPLGASAATMAVFLASGLIHDLVISLPARAGWGLPTLYFVLQGLGVLAEHSPLARAIGLGHGKRGRAFCIAIVVLPLPMLFHAAFIDRVILPMLHTLSLA